MDRADCLRRIANHFALLRRVWSPALFVLAVYTIVLERIHEGDPATIKLMGYSQHVRGHVGSVARGIDIPNARPDQSGLASVNPIFTWVRLAQRVPVRLDIDQVPDGVRLVAGMTAAVQIEERKGVGAR